MNIEAIYLQRRANLLRYISRIEAEPQRGEPRNKTQLATRLGIHKSELNAFITEPLRAGKRYAGWRGIKDDRAKLWAVKLGLPVGFFDDGVLTDTPAVSVDQGALPPVEALRFAVQSLFSVLNVQRRAEAVAIAADIRHAAGAERAADGLLSLLLGILEASPKKRTAPARRRA